MTCPQCSRPLTASYAVGLPPWICRSCRLGFYACELVSPLVDMWDTDLRNWPTTAMTAITAAVAAETGGG